MSGHKALEDRPPVTRGRPASPNPESRQRLLQAARALMAETPAAQVSLRAVAEQAGYDPALLSYYFGSKAGLVRAVLEEAASDATKQLAAVQQLPGSLADRLKASIRDSVAALNASPYLARLVMQQVVVGNDEQAEDFVRRLGIPYLSGVAALVEEGVRTGEFRDVDEQLIVYALSALPLFFQLLAPVFGDLLGNDATRDPSPSQDFADAVADLLLRGVLAPAAAEHAEADAAPPNRSRQR
jgi:TetR/AcrR family transcriptional regulator